MDSARGAAESDLGRLPQLRVSSLLGERWFALVQSDLTLGRDSACDIWIDLNVVSRLHARLVQEGSTYRFVQVGTTNPTLLNSTPVETWLLQDGDRLEIVPGTPDAVTLTFELTDPAVERTMPFRRQGRSAPDETARIGGRLALPTRGTLVIGRSARADLVLSSLSVSRRHARLDIDDGVVRLTDEGSANGTFVNGVAVQTRILAVGDIVRIGPYKLSYRDNSIEHHDDSRAVRLDVHGVTKTVGERILLESVSFTARPGEVLAIAGTSGAGKSTLMDALNGTRPPTSGRVLVNGADLYRAYDALRPLIGYVPQETILPAQLSVRRALHYVARLRLPPDVTQADSSARVEQVMQALDLSARRDVPIGRLSGGQQKRASIAAELIASPGLFFLDEPTSGLDPGLTRRVTGIIRDLARAGSTIILISHDVESLQAADRIVFLGAGGRVVFIGTPAEALDYFSVDDFAAIYARVESEDSASWAERLRRSPHYQEHVAPTLAMAAPSEGEDAPVIQWDPIAMIGAGARRGSSAWRQFRIATTRYMESLLRDRTYLALLLAQAPIIALLLVLVANPSDLHPPPPEAVTEAARLGIPAAALAAGLSIMLAASATWFGAINAAREIVKELPMLRRERLAGLRVAPYLGSKVVVLMLLCLSQTAALLGIVWLKVDLPSSGALMWAPLELWITLNLAAVAALGLGLVISASFSNPDRAQSLVPILLIPQLIFVGGPGDGVAARWISYLMVTHWSVEAMKVTARIPYNAAGTGFDANDLLIRWLALAVMTLIFVALAAVQLARKRAG